MTARLPTVGSDAGQWGTILNTFLQVSHASDGTLNSGVVGPSQLQSAAVGATQANLSSLAGGMLLRGVLSSRPAALNNNGLFYVATDINSGTLYQSNGSTWIQIAIGVSQGQAPSGSAGGDLGGTYPSPTVTSTHLSSALSVSQGGTGSASQNFVDLTTAQSIGGTKTFTSAMTGQSLGLSTTASAGAVLTVANTTSAPTADNFLVKSNAAGDKAVGINVAGDTVDRLTIDSNGKHAWGAGGANATDTTLYRSAAATLKTDAVLAVGTSISAGSTISINGSANAGLLQITNSTAITNNAGDITVLEAVATSPAFGCAVNGDPDARYYVLANGQMTWGPGNVSADTILGRAAIGVLYTPKNILIGSSTALGDNGVGGIQLADATTPPATNPSGGVDIYATSTKATVVKIRDTAGNIRSVSDGFARCTATETARTTTTQTPSPSLTMAVEASAVYFVHLFAIITTTGTGATNSLACSWTGPTGATMPWGDTNTTSDFVSTIGGVRHGNVNCDGASHLLIIEGTLTTSTTAGSLTYTTAVSGTSGSPTPSVTIAAGSYLRLTRVG